MTQQETILRHIQTHKRGITQKEAIDKYGCTRLAAVVKALQKKGYNIKSEREKVDTRYSKRVSIARYTMGG